jgi:hypothetical protein
VPGSRFAEEDQRNGHQADAHRGATGPNRGCDHSCAIPPSTHAEPTHGSHDRGEVQAAGDAHTRLAQVGEAHDDRTRHRQEVRRRPHDAHLHDLERGRVVVGEVRHRPVLEGVEAGDHGHAHEPGDEDQLPPDRLLDRRQRAERDRREHDEQRQREDQEPRTPGLVARREDPTKERPAAGPSLDVAGAGASVRFDKAIREGM